MNKLMNSKDLTTLFRNLDKLFLKAHKGKVSNNSKVVYDFAEKGRFGRIIQTENIGLGLKLKRYTRIGLSVLTISGADIEPFGIVGLRENVAHTAIKEVMLSKLFGLNETDITAIKRKVKGIQHWMNTRPYSLDAVAKNVKELRELV